MKKIVGSVVFVACLLALPISSVAEWYTGVMGGYTIPNDFSDRSENFGGMSVDTPDTDLHNSFLVGGKGGYYFDQIRWVGVETEVFYTQPGFGNDAVGITGNVDVVTWATNAVVRYPGERWQPYMGAGLGVLFVNVNYDQYPGGDGCHRIGHGRGLQCLSRPAIPAYRSYRPLWGI